MKTKLNSREIKFRAKQQAAYKFPQRNTGFSWLDRYTEPNSDAVEKLVKKVIR